MQPREKIIVESSGKPGSHGFQYYGERDGVAPAGRPGANGRSSCNPTDGEDARDIHVELCPPRTPGTVVVKGMRGWENTIWEVDSEHILLLDCKGGDGGDGGRGEDGQQGGGGERGRNATKYRDAEHGGMGARGGDGGYGSNGAAGGKAGSVFVQVGEEDMDLLLPLFWDIRGGKGGASGTHGEPGDGGIGGQGGDGITWVERYGDRTVQRSRPRGAPGPQGPPGSRPSSYLSGGASGANGSSQITVKRKDGTQATYPSAYLLKVVSFDIVDENEDGVNEPGEHLIIKNIRVENIGGMPSPKSSEISVLIHGTHWLDPVMSEPVYLPNDIQPGQTVQVPGKLRAFIQQERSARGPGQLLHSNDEIQLIATATRLSRTLPDFSGKTNIVIRYPLELDAPKYLDCVQKGDEVTFSWVLRNVSTKPYGVQGLLKRDSGTVLAEMYVDGETGWVFDFADAGSHGQHKVIDMLDELEPGEEVPISQTIQVSNRALPYSEARLKLELMISEPHKNDKSLHCELPTDHAEEDIASLRSAVWYGMRLQIAGTYSLTPDAAFLMVVNAHTANQVIRQVMAFIQRDLGLDFDVFNASLSGTLTSPVTGRHVLEDYQGKGVLLFTNTFPYFRRGTRTIFDMIDPHCAGRLARAGTNFLLLGPSQGQEKAIEWSSMLKFVKHTPTEEDEQASSHHAPTKKALHKTIYERGYPRPSHHLPRHTFPAKKGLFSSADSSLEKDAKNTAASLHKTFPLRRFAVHGSPEAREEKVPGHIEVFETLPMSSSIRYSLQDFDGGEAGIPDFNKFAIVSALPFKMRAKMIWNIMQTAGTTMAVRSTDLYKLKDSSEKREISITVSEEKSVIVQERVVSAIFLSVEHDLIQEFSLFNSKVPWPDVLPGPDSIQQLPLTMQFFEAASKSGVQLTTTEGTSNLSQILGTLTASLTAIGFWQCFGRTVLFGLGSRKATLLPQLNKKTQALLSSSFTADTAKQVQTAIAEKAHVDKAYLKMAGSTHKGLQDLAQKRIKSYIKDGSSTSYIDLPHLHPVTRGTELMAKGEPGRRTDVWKGFMGKVEEDWREAEVLRREIVGFGSSG